MLFVLRIITKGNIVAAVGDHLYITFGSKNMTTDSLDGYFHSKWSVFEQKLCNLGVVELLCLCILLLLVN